MAVPIIFEIGNTDDPQKNIHAVGALGDPEAVREFVRDQISRELPVPPSAPRTTQDAHATELENERKEQAKRRLQQGIIFVLDKAIDGDASQFSRLRNSIEDFVAAVIELEVRRSEQPDEPSLRYIICRRDPERRLEPRWQSLFESAALQPEGPGKGAVNELASIEGPVLIEGAVGSGKTHFARQVHSERAALSGRRHKAAETPLVIENFGHVDAMSLDAMIRGVEKGSFTDVAARAGLFERARGGVLVLDDFQNASLESQVRLLDLLSASSDLVRLEHRHGGAKRPVEGLMVKTVLIVNERLEDLLRAGRVRRDLLSRVRRIHRLQTWDDLARPIARDRYRRDALSIVHALRFRLAPRLLTDGVRWLDDGTAVTARQLMADLTPSGWRTLMEWRFEDQLRGLSRCIADLHWEAAKTGATQFDEELVKKCRLLGPGIRGSDQPEPTPRTHGGVGSSAEHRPELLLADRFRAELKSLLQEVGEELDWSIVAMSKALPMVRERKTLRSWLLTHFPEFRDRLR